MKKSKTAVVGLDRFFCLVFCYRILKLKCLFSEGLFAAVMFQVLYYNKGRLIIWIICLFLTLTLLNVQFKGIN